MTVLAPASLASREPRRTQQERRDRTRGVLLEATVECLVERGYHGTTTLEVERRAEVSRGARIHHFPTKQVLLASAVDHLYNLLSEHYDEAFGDVTAGEAEAARFRRGFALLWSIYRRPGYVAVLELIIAARTDAELRARLDEVNQRHRALAAAAAARHFPSLAAPVAAVLIEALNATMMGLLVQRFGTGENPCEREVLALLEDAVVRHLPPEESPCSSS